VKRPNSSSFLILAIGICAALVMPAGVALAADNPLCQLLPLLCGTTDPTPTTPPPGTTTGTTTGSTVPTTTTTDTTTATTTTTETTTTAAPPPARECVAGVGEVDRRQVGPIRLGDPVEGVKRAVEVRPRAESTGLLRYCVRGGGRIDVTFAHGRTGLIVARAQGYRYHGYGIGDSTAKLRKGKFGAKRSGSEGYRIGKVLIGARDGFVTYVAPARGSLLHDRSALEHHLKRAGLH
jgi:hypothetical protein